MTSPRRATGTFVVDLAPQGDADAADGVTLGRALIRKRFDGDLVGRGDGEMLSVITSTPGSAGYVAVERVAGTLHGRRGGFVLQHSGRLDRGTPRLEVAVVPDSGHGELAGISGVFSLDVVDGVHRYTFDYLLPEP